MAIAWLVLKGINSLYYITTLYRLELKYILTGLALASSQVANGYQASPLATEQRAGVAKLATGVCRSMWQVSSSEYLGVTYQKDTKDIGYCTRNLAMTFRGWVAKMALLGGKPAPAQNFDSANPLNKLWLIFRWRTWLPWHHSWTLWGPTGQKGGPNA